MPKGDAEPIVLEDFKGLWARTPPLPFNGGLIYDTPEDHFSVAKNLAHFSKYVKSREGYAPLPLGFALAAPISRFWIYPKDGDANLHFIILAGGAIYDSASPTASTPILSNIPNNDDISIVVLFNRVYITIHNRQTGEVGLSVYVYKGDGTAARLAAGSGPGSAASAVTSATAGNVSAGTHIIGIAFETDTGFLTQSSRVVYTAPAAANKSIDLSGIPTGPAGTVARRVLVSKALPFYDGNIAAAQLFFLQRIADNTSTTLTINFYDTQLSSDASYLDTLLVSIPAGVGIGQYQGRLTSWGENANQTVIRMSRSGDPESVDSTGGFITLPVDGGPVLNTFEWRGLYYMCKRYRTYVTRDNGGSPNTWQVEQVDGAIGTECFGIARVGDISVSATRDIVLVANRQGLYIFRGSYLDKPLTWKIEGLWEKQFFGASFSYIQCWIDQYAKRVYVSFIGDNVGPTGLLVGDFRDGLDPNNIKWEPWSFNNDLDRPLAVGVYVSRASSSTKSLYMAIGDSNIYQFDPALKTDRGQPLLTSIQFPYLPFADDLSISGLSWLRFLMDISDPGGAPTAFITFRVGNYAEAGASYTIDSIASPIRNPYLPKTVPIDMTGEMFVISFVNVAAALILYKVIAGGKPLYQSRQVLTLH